MISFIKTLQTFNITGEAGHIHRQLPQGQINPKVHMFKGFTLFQEVQKTSFIVL